MKKILSFIFILFFLFSCGAPVMAEDAGVEASPNLQIIFEPTRTVVAPGDRHRYTASFNNYIGYGKNISSMEITVRMTDQLINYVEGSGIALIDSAEGNSLIEYSEKTRILKFTFNSKKDFLDKKVSEIFSFELKAGESFERDRTVIIDTTATVYDDSPEKTKIPVTAFRFEINGDQSLNVLGPESFYKSDGPNARPNSAVNSDVKRPSSADSKVGSGAVSNNNSNVQNYRPGQGTIIFIILLVLAAVAAVITAIVVIIRKRK